MRSQASVKIYLVRVVNLLDLWEFEIPSQDEQIPGTAYQ